MKKSMNDCWNSPKTRIEKAEYQRMRREWAQLQQQEYNSSQKSNDFKKSFKSTFVVCLCLIFIFVSWFFNNGLDLNVGKKVSYNANFYLEQATMCTLKWNELVSIMNNSIVDINAYSDEMDSLLKEIELLNEKSISRFDNLKSYEATCDAYFGCIYSFFASVKEQHFFSFDAYNRFLIELNSLENPYNHLLKVFDEHGYYYYIDSDKEIHYKVDKSLF